MSAEQEPNGIGGWKWIFALSFIGLIGSGIYFRFGTAHPPGIETAADFSSAHPTATTSGQSETSAANSKTISNQPTAPVLSKSVGSERSPASYTQQSQKPAPRNLVSRGWLAEDPFVGAQVLSFEESPHGPSGEYTRSRVVRTDMKYPLVLVEESFAPDPGTGKDRISKRTAMVADHVLVKLRSGYNEQDLYSLAIKHGATVRSKFSEFGNYILGFEANDVSALKQMIQELRQSPVISDPEPDYIVSR